MFGRTTLGAAIMAIVALAMSAATLAAAPVKLPRHPDYRGAD